MKYLAAALMVISASVAADPWKTIGSMAIKDNGKVADVVITFVESAPSECGAVALMIVGNDDINAISFCTDQECFEKSPVEGSLPLDGEPNVYLRIRKEALNALANHHIAEFETDQGNLTITLAGSKQAMFDAHANCVRNATVTVPDKRLEKPQQPAIREPEASDEFKVYADGVML